MEAMFSSQKCKTNQDNHILNKIDAKLESHHTVFPIEDLCLRFSCVCDVIFNYLDTKSLINCRLISTTLKNQVDNHKPFWKSIIQKFLLEFVNHPKFKKSVTKYVTEEYDWNTFLDKTPVKIIKEITLAAVKEFKSSYLYVSPQQIASTFGFFDSFKFICEKTKDYSPPSHYKSGCNLTPFHIAAEKGYFNICQLIIENIDDCNPSVCYDRTPLGIAAQNDHYEICKLIIENLPDVNYSNKFGPLHIVTSRGYFDLCQVLIKNMTDKNPVDKYGMIPLHHAARRG